MKAAVSNIVKAEIEAAITMASDGKRRQEDRVHEVRKTCKKMRALLRLIRQCDERMFQHEESVFRKIARQFAKIREAEVMVDCHDSLLTRFVGEADRGRFARLRRRLCAQRRAARESAKSINARLAQFAGRMRGVGERLPDWSRFIDEPAVLVSGFVTTYRRARKAMRRAREEPSDENFHEWRKRAKYHGYQIRLIRGFRKSLSKIQWGQIEKLWNALGDEHDLTVYRQALLLGTAEPGSEGERRDMLDLIDRRRAELREGAMRLGRTIFAGKPSRLGRRLRGQLPRRGI